LRGRRLRLSLAAHGADDPPPNERRHVAVGVDIGHSLQGGVLLVGELEVD